MSILAGGKVPDRKADAARAADVTELETLRTENTRLAALVESRGAEYQSLEKKLKEEREGRALAEAALKATNDRLNTAREELQAARIGEASLRANLDAAVDTRDEAVRARGVAERAMLSAIERQTTVIDRTVHPAAPQPAAGKNPPPTYRLVVANRDGNGHLQELLITPIEKGK